MTTIVFCGDLLLTGNMVFWLLVHAHTRSTSSILCDVPCLYSAIAKLLFPTVLPPPFSTPSFGLHFKQPAAPAALCALITFAVAIQLYKSWMPAVMINCIATMVLPQLYAWSAMWTLNSRGEIRLAVENTPYTINLGTSLVSSESEPRTET
ncbi:hypothetical protein K438DRAFT_1965504 [Mycena galopus ATCC 62051]|nr:hypothetical protein K438DRAFT_1965504 [Mycena galopus ATCC 62051]